MVRIQVSVRNSDARRLRSVQAPSEFSKLENASHTVLVEQRRHLPETKVPAHGRFHQLCAQPPGRRNDPGRSLLSHLTLDSRSAFQPVRISVRIEFLAGRLLCPWLLAPGNAQSSHCALPEKVIRVALRQTANHRVALPVQERL